MQAFEKVSYEKWTGRLRSVHFGIKRMDISSVVSLLNSLGMPAVH